MSMKLIRLRDWLDDRPEGLTDAAFARSIEISPAHLSDIIAGKSRCSPEVAGKIQRATGIDARYVLGIEIPEEAA